MATTRHFIGIEIGGTKLQLIVGDENAQVLEKFHFQVNQAAGAAGIRQHIQDALKQIGTNTIAGVGAGFGGPIDRTTGKIWTSYHISGWSGFPLKTWLEDISGGVVAIDNDANVAALGEAVHGAGKAFHHVFYVTLGSGVGAGLVVDKTIYHGALPGECELGHVRLDKAGATLESSCSGWAVNEKIKTNVVLHPDSELASIVRNYPGAESKGLLEAIQKNNRQADEILKTTVDDFAFGVAHAVHLLHPEIIVLGGGLSLIGEPFRKLVEQYLPRYLMDAFQPGPLIQLSELRENVVPVGAIALAKQMLGNPVVVK